MMTQSLESETDHHRGEQNRQRTLQTANREKCDEISKEMKSMVDQDLLEEGFHCQEHTASRSSRSDEVLAEQRYLSSRGVSILLFQ